MLKLRQFDLQFSFFGPGALSKNVENQRSAVEDLAVENPLQIAALRGRKFVIEDDGIDVLLATKISELVGFARADECPGDWRFQLLCAVADDFSTGGGSQFLEFGERILKLPRGA